MVEVTLLIQNGQEVFEVKLEESLTIGRSDAATVMVADDGLSRLHASIHRKAGTVWIVDENSTNGCFVNGHEVKPEGATLNDGDEILIGNHTTIFVEIRERATRANARPSSSAPKKPAPAAQTKTGKSFFPKIDFTSPLFIGLSSAALIILLAAVAIFLTRDVEETKPARKAQTRKILFEPQIRDSLIDDWDVEEPPLEEEQPDDVPLGEALLKAKEERGEPVGYEASVEIPAELKHYSDRRRNLAIQAAETIEQNLRIPHDFAELARMVRDKQFVELKTVGENYVQYAVGGGVSTAPFTHYEKSQAKSVPLYKSQAEVQAGLSALPDSDERKAFIASYYQAAAARTLAANEAELLSQVARDFGKRTFDLADAAQRKAFKRRLLGYLRPEALKVLDELGLAYKTKFNRLLPLASLIRTEEYQKELSERNANAARNSLPPHTTGLAFDISYRYMTAAEQNFLMAEIARLEAAGRVEALRENNNCFHIFAFPDGRPPPESLIQKAM